jgi:hypothetical protein
MDPLLTMLGDFLWGKVYIEAETQDLMHAKPTLYP